MQYRGISKKMATRPRRILANTSVLIVSFGLLLPTAFAAETSQLEVRTVKGAQTEDHERMVDRAAISSQEHALSKLKGMLAKYRGKSQEPSFLFKLGEIQQQTAAMRFRVAHGSAFNGKRKIDLSPYRNTMRESIASFGELIKKYPSYEEIPQAYFLRGKAYEEVEDKASATHDYLHLVKNFPEAPEAIPAYMSLAQFAIDDNQHAKAITYLSEVEKQPEDPQYPFALYKLAWAYYNLKNIPTALSFAERHVAYYDAKLTGTNDDIDGAITSDVALRDNTLQDITVFYMEGFENDSGRYTTADALPYFRKLNQGAPLGRMLTRYAKLLRSHGHEEQLITWKNLVLKGEFKRPEALEVVNITYEFQFNRRRHKLLPETAMDMVRIYDKFPKHEAFIESRKLLLDTAEDIQKVLVKNKGAEGLSEMSQTLARIYDSFTKIVDDSDPRIPRVHYNLAETLFEIQQFEQATVHYRWVVDHGKWDRKQTAAGNVADASLKAISARYQVLKGLKLVPDNLTPLPFPKEDPAKLQPKIAEWIEWIDEHVSRTGNPIDNFDFEATRALYAQGHVIRALKRMQRFSEKNPDSKFAIPAASLALDTHVKSERWAEANDLALEFLKIKAWKSTDFGKRLLVIAADTAYKILEVKYAAKDWKTSLSMADQFLKKYAASARIADALTLAGSAAMQVGDPGRAERYYTRMINETPNATSVAQAYLARAKLAEDRYEFAAAARDYKAYLDLPEKIVKIKDSDAEVIRAKTLALAWLSGDAAILGLYLNAKGLCTQALARDCDRYQGVIALERQVAAPSHEATMKAFDQSRKGFSENRALWAAIALEGAKDLVFRDRNVMLRQLADGWNDLDAGLRFSLTSRLSETVPRTFALNRASMKEVAPLLAREKWITRRIEVIRELENAATSIMKKLPWNRIRALTLNEIANVYVDLSKGLSSLAAPKDLPTEEVAAYEGMIRKLVVPFEEKAQEMRGKAYEIASRNAIEEFAFHAVADPYFTDNPRLAAKLKLARPPAPPMPLDLVSLQALDPQGEWDALSEKSNKPAVLLRARWARAVREKRWAQVSFFMAEAKEKKLFTPSAEVLTRAVSFYAAGARAEALALVFDSVNLIDENRRPKAVRLLIDQYLVTYSRERVASLLKRLEALDPRGAPEVAAAIEWGDSPKKIPAPGQAQRAVAGDKS